MGGHQKISFVPENVDLALYAGDGAAVRLTVKDSLGNTLNVSGAVLAQVRNERTDATPLQSFTVDLSQGAAGIVRVSLSGTQTAALMNGEDPFSGYWDVQWTGTAAQPITLVQGKVSCTRDVTR